MTDDTLLADSQARIQGSMEKLVGDLLAQGATEEVWETDLARIRYESEESWERCNAFLFGYTAARFAATLPSSADGPDAEALHVEFATPFIHAVRDERFEEALALWLAAPGTNPRAAAMAKQTAMLTAILERVRCSFPAGARPLLGAAYPFTVWIEYTHTAPSLGTEESGSLA